MNKILSTLIVSAFAAVAFNASAASHAGAPMATASAPAAKASAPAAKASAPAMEKKEVKPAASAPAK
jgi:hypothetical protein